MHINTEGISNFVLELPSIPDKERLFKKSCKKFLKIKGKFFIKYYPKKTDWDKLNIKNYSGKCGDENLDTLFKKYLSDLISFVDENEDILIVFPPLKTNKSITLKWIYNKLKQNKKYNILIINSPDYSMHNQHTKLERMNAIQKAFKEWKNNGTTDIKKFKTAVFIDDIFTNGSTTKYIMEFLRNNGFKFSIKNSWNDLFIDNIFCMYLARTYNKKFSEDKEENYPDEWVYDKELSKKIENKYKLL